MSEAISTATPEVGQPAPDFSLPTDGGGQVTLSALRGRPVVVYFYPKDDTSGCTAQAISFTERQAEFEAAGAQIIGISADSTAAHDKFKAKHRLGITLASAEDRKVLEDYGVWTQKSMYGRTYMGIERTTFLIDREGRIARIWPKVKVKGHADEVLEAVRAL